MGEMDFLVGGIMIGGFALVAAPADYGVRVTASKIAVIGLKSASKGLAMQGHEGLRPVREFKAFSGDRPG